MSKRTPAKSSRAKHARGIEVQQQKEKTFFQLAERFRAARDPEQVKQLGDQLGRLVFGEYCADSPFPTQSHRTRLNGPPSESADTCSTGERRD
jgi:hypothetical protein